MLVPNSSFLEKNVTNWTLSDQQLRFSITLSVVYGSAIRHGVRAMKRGAVDFLLKPLHEEELLAAISQAVERHAREQARGREWQDIAGRLGRLSAREREVMEHVIRGSLNKQIAAELEIAEKTVKVHRGRVMERWKCARSQSWCICVRPPASHCSRPMAIAPRPALSWLASASFPRNCCGAHGPPPVIPASPEPSPTIGPRSNFWPSRRTLRFGKAFQKR